MNAALALLLLFVAAVSGASFDFGFSRNVSLSGANRDDFAFRSTTLEVLGAGNYVSGAYFKSRSIGRTNNSATGDIIWGATWIGNDDVPLNWLAYWDTQLEFEIGSGFVDLNVSGSNAYIASAYLAIEEHTPNDTVVASQWLANRLNPYLFQWSLTDYGIPSGNLQIGYATFTGHLPGEAWDVTITNVVSSTTGVISYANAIVSPKSFETIVSINNWPYQSSENELVLVMGVATGNGQATDAYNYKYGEGTSSVYYRVGTSAVVNGAVSAVQSMGYSNVDYNGYISYIKNTTVYGQLMQRFSASVNIDVELVSVKFPAGASQITYDPDTGAGNAVGDTTTNSSASVLSYGLILALLSLLLSLF